MIFKLKEKIALIIEYTTTESHTYNTPLKMLRKWSITCTTLANTSLLLLSTEPNPAYRGVLLPYMDFQESGSPITSILNC